MKLTHLAILLSLMFGSCWAQPVARVQSLTGNENLQILTAAANRPSQAKVETKASVGDQLWTDKKTMATLRFYLGGQANLDKGSKIQIINAKDFEVKSRTIKLKEGNFWAKFDKQKAPIKIQTSGGVMGIRGTEFIVQVDGQGNTVLSLLEGRVDVTDNQGQSYQALPGAEVAFGRGAELQSQLFTVEQLLTRRSQDLSEEFMELRQDLLKLGQDMRRLNETLARDLGGIPGIANFQTVIAARLGSRQAQRGITNNLNDRKSTRESMKGTDKKLSRAEELLAKLDRANQEGQPSSEPQKISVPEFKWAAAADANQQFAVMILPETGYTPIWTDTTSTNRYQYPADAAPLSSGTYRLRVAAIDENFQTTGDITESSFVIP